MRRCYICSQKEGELVSVSWGTGNTIYVHDAPKPCWEQFFREHPAVKDSLALCLGRVTEDDKFPEPWAKHTVKMVIANDTRIPSIICKKCNYEEILRQESEWKSWVCPNCK